MRQSSCCKKRMGLVERIAAVDLVERIAIVVEQLVVAIGLILELNHRDLNHHPSCFLQPYVLPRNLHREPFQSLQFRPFLTSYHLLLMVVVALEQLVLVLVGQLERQL